MSDNVVYLHGKPASIAHFVKVGTSGHKQLQLLLANDQLPMKRFVFRAGVVQQQLDLLKDLGDAGCETCLDTDAAELSVVGRYGSSARNAPWATDKMLKPALFERTSSLYDEIAQFAVKHRFDRVQAPAHLIRSHDDFWSKIDIGSVNFLRKSLDANGGSDIRVDFPLLVPKNIFDDAMHRRALIEKLKDCPYDQLWLRVAGFGADATSVSIKKYILSASDFHVLERPIIADSAAGFAAMSLPAFGAVSGISHGVCEGERFDASRWFKPPDGKKGGSTRSILIPGLDRMFSLDAAKTLMNVPHARRLIGCNRPDCCPRGFDDTIRNPKAHYLKQRALYCDGLSKIPEKQRSRHFLDYQLADQARVARQAATLKADDKMRDLLGRASHRLDLIRQVLEKLNDSGVQNSSAKPVSDWQANQTNVAVTGPDSNV